MKRYLVKLDYVGKPESEFYHGRIDTWYCGLRFNLLSGYEAKGETLDSFVKLFGFKSKRDAMNCFSYKHLIDNHDWKEHSSIVAVSI